VITAPKCHGRTDGQTDRQTIYCDITALCIASHGKKISIARNMFTVYDDYYYKLCFAMVASQRKRR